MNLLPLPGIEPRFLVQPTLHGPLVFLKRVSLSTDFRLLMLRIKADLFFYVLTVLFEQDRHVCVSNTVLLLSLSA
jgi:hypothetical protein